MIQEEIDDKLLLSRERVRQQISSESVLPQFPPLIEVRRSIEGDVAEVFKDTLIYDPIEQEKEAFRQLRSTIRAQGNTYLILVRSPKVEAEDLLLAIGKNKFDTGHSLVWGPLLVKSATYAEVMATIPTIPECAAGFFFDSPQLD